MAEKLTRCPKCKTTFRILDAHLKSASGSVRCGACLHVFNARMYLQSAITVEREKEASLRSNNENKIKSDSYSPAAKPSHQVDEREPESPSNKSSAKPKFVQSSKSLKHTQETDDESHRSNTLVRNNREEKPQQAQPVKKSESNKSRPKPPKHTDTAAQAKRSEDRPTTEAKKNTTSKSLLDEEDDFLISDDTIKKSFDDGKSQFAEEDDFFGDSGTKKSDEIRSNLFERNAKEEDDDENESYSDETWALDLLSSIEDRDAEKHDTSRNVSKSEQAKKSSKTASKKRPSEELHHIDDYDLPETQHEATNNFLLVDDDDEVETWSSTEDFSGYEDILSEFDEPETDSGNKSKKKKTGFLDAIEPEPVEISGQHGAKAWVKQALWACASVVLVGVMVLQLAYWNFYRWTQNPAYRPYYQQACSLLGCQIPLQSDHSKIRAKNLVVRPHPEKNDALLVDVIIENTANFEQYFPSLDLVFRDLRGNPVAARRFTPQDYLAGELRGAKIMPQKQPVHIAFAIRDPGPGAMGGYRVFIAR